MSVPEGISHYQSLCGWCHSLSSLEYGIKIKFKNLNKVSGKMD
jgi:hypothetical protein